MGILENQAQKISRNQDSLASDISEEWLGCFIGDVILPGTSAAIGGGFLSCLFILLSLH